MKNLSKVALLATGDELVHGDIANTNAQDIARKLYDQGIQIGTHMVAADDIPDIEQAIRYLLDTHQALIMTGGLGPTSDDLTRYALSRVLGVELVFDVPSWEKIVARLKRFGYPTPPESNRQQALFPEGALIIENPNGTAAGCMSEMQSKLIFMLPGPPMECLPMLQAVVLPKLKSAGFTQVEYHKKWLLFGVSEGQIAETLDQLAKPFQCTTGYRLCYPYIEFKIHSSHQQDFANLSALIEIAIAPYLIVDGEHIASDLLRKHLETIDFTINISDSATGGLLESTIKTPKNNAVLNFLPDQPNVKIEGLTEFWQQKSTTQTTITITFDIANQHRTLTTAIPFRGSRVKSYATEFICWKIYDMLRGTTK